MDFLLGKSPVPAPPPASQPQGESHALGEILAELGERPVDDIDEDDTLGGDLNLDSLKRIELLSMLEEKIGVSMACRTMSVPLEVADAQIGRFCTPHRDNTPHLRLHGGAIE